jgi:hypothetical protein
VTHDWLAGRIESAGFSIIRRRPDAFWHVEPHLEMMDDIDLNQPAELYTTKGSGKKQPLTYRRFSSAAEAIRFAMEELSPELLARTVLEVDESRFDGPQIKELYIRKNA